MRARLFATLLSASVGTLTPHAARAERDLGVGFALRSATSEPSWAYHPLVIPAGLVVRDLIRVHLRVELGNLYAAVRSGVGVQVCAPQSWQCVVVELSAGAASAAFSGERPIVAGIFGGVVGLVARLPDRYTLRIDGEIFGLWLPAASTWDRGIGVGLGIGRRF